MAGRDPLDSNILCISKLIQTNSNVGDFQPPPQNSKLDQLLEHLEDHRIKSLLVNILNLGL